MNEREPKDALVLVDEGLFRGETTIRIGPAFTMPVASALWRDVSGAVTIISPIAFSDEQARAIDALGTVSHLVAPCRFHHLALPKAIARWPRAKVWGAPGLARKRPDIRFDGELRSGSTEVPETDVVLLDGAPDASELMLFHRPTRSLVLTDLLFNLGEDEGGGWLGRLYFWASGALGRPAPSIWWRFLVKDRAAAAASLERILGMDIARVLPSHGRPLTGEVKAVLRAALSRILAGA